MMSEHSISPNQTKPAPEPSSASIAASIAASAPGFVIIGQTQSGSTFRPSDWAERLAGVMAHFRPRRAGPQQHLGYSPYVRPSQLGQHKCVYVDARLREIEPMAMTFLVGFAADNHLRVQALSKEDLSA